MVKGFRDFILRGNVVDLAVAVIIGAAFGGVVSAFAEDFVGGLIGAIGGSKDFGTAGVTINDSRVIWGSTLTALVNFLLIAAVLYFVVVVPMKTLAERRREGVEADTPAPSDETVLLSEIRDLLRTRQDS